MVLRCTVGRKVISIRRNPLYTVLLLRRRRHERHDVRRKNKNSSYRGTAATTQQQQQSDILTMHSYRRLTVHLLFTKSELCCVVASTIACQPDGHELDFTSGWNLRTFVKKKKWHQNLGQPGIKLLPGKDLGKSRKICDINHITHRVSIEWSIQRYHNESDMPKWRKVATKIILKKKTWNFVSPL